VVLDYSALMKGSKPGCAVIEVVSHWYLTAYTGVSSWADPSKFVVDILAVGQYFLSTLVSSCQYYPNTVPSSS
jgi:hypothetical protein